MTKTTTAHILEHFKRADPILFRYARNSKLELLRPQKPSAYFANLCREIVYQQLSDRAGSTIWKRVEALFPKGVSPEYMLNIPDETLRAAGSSWSKVAFMKDLALKVKEKQLRLTRLAKLSHEQVIGELTKVKGIGLWTAHMFLMFSLGHEDLFSPHDLGLRNAIKKIYRLSENPTQKEMETLTKKWSPFRTYACLILWNALDKKN